MKTSGLSEHVLPQVSVHRSLEQPVPRKTKRRLDADLLTSAEIEALMKACSPRAATGIRNRALIALAWRSGLRIGEIIALKPKDVDFEVATVTVLHGKNDRPRIVGLDSGTTALIKEWVDVRKERKLRPGASLFCTLAGTQLDQSYVRHLFPRLARRAGITKRVHAHGLRHVFAVQLQREGAPLSVIRDCLGHSSAAVTDIYLRRGGAGEAVAFTRDRDWTPSSPSFNQNAASRRDDNEGDEA